MGYENIIDKRFKRYVEYSNEAIEFLGLHSFSFTFELNEDSNSFFKARTNWHNIFNEDTGGARTFYIEVCADWLETEDDETGLRATAWHEVLEAFLHRLTDMAGNHEYYVRPSDVANEIHNVIRLFENKVLPLIYEKRTQK
jgi:hypothetical protein